MKRSCRKLDHSSYPVLPGETKNLRTPPTRRAMSPEQWAQCLAQESLPSIIEMLGQPANPDEREINLKGQSLNDEQAKKLALLVAHAECPPFALNLERATAPMTSDFLGQANLHKPLTMLNLRGFKVTMWGKKFRLADTHIAAIADLLRPGSKLQELILDRQQFVSQMQLDLDETSLERNFTGLPLQMSQQLEANRRQRVASAMETVLCVQQHFVPPELGGVIAGLIFDVQRSRAAELV